jgi:hypothetical protein
MGKMDDLEIYVENGEVKVAYKRDYRMGYDGFGSHSHGWASKTK